MEDKKYKRLVFIIIILTILVISLLSYIAYQEFYNNKTTNDGENIIENNKPNNTENNIIDDISEFPQTSDNSIIFSAHLKDLFYDENDNALISMQENFQNISYKTSSNIKYTLSCDRFFENNYYDDNPKLSVCDKIKIKFDDYNTNLFFEGGIGCGDKTFIIITNDYLIEQQISGCGTPSKLTIFNKYGDTVFIDHYTQANYSTPIDYTDKNVKMAVIDNVLYYTSHDGNPSILHFYSLDLKNMQKTEIQSFNIIIQG